MNDPSFVLRNGVRTMPNGARILDGVDLTVRRGESVAIVGRSGSGKSTLLAGMGLLARFDRGTSFSLGDRDVLGMNEQARARLRAKSIGFVLQNSGLIEHLSALENVRMPLLHARDVRPRRAKARALTALREMNIEDLARRRPSQVSGGERQRIAVARALVIQPSLILADEPTGALDEQTGHTVLQEMLFRVKSTGAALVVVTHDAEVAAQMDRVYRLDSGRLHLLSEGAA